MWCSIMQKGSEKAWTLLRKDPFCERGSRPVWHAAHINVSWKDRSNTRKLSPKNNHIRKKNCGNEKGGFARTDFPRKCETSFDKYTGYDRVSEQTFDYFNTMKNGSPKENFQMKEWEERVNMSVWRRWKPMEPESSDTEPRIRSGREPTKGKQYIPDSGHRPGSAKEEAVGGRTRLAEEEKS